MASLGSPHACSSLRLHCRQPQHALSPQRTATKRLQLARAAPREPFDDSGGSSASAAGSAPFSLGGEQLRRLQERMAVHAERMDVFAQQQDFQAAAIERDALRQMELRARQLELAAATAQQQAAGIQHPLGAVVRHRYAVTTAYCCTYVRILLEDKAWTGGREAACTRCLGSSRIAPCPASSPCDTPQALPLHGSDCRVRRRLPGTRGLDPGGAVCTNSRTGNAGLHVSRGYLLAAPSVAGLGGWPAPFPPHTGPTNALCR